MRGTGIAALAALLLALPGGAGEPHDHPAAAIADPRFEFLAGLAGTWVTRSGPEDMRDSLIEFRVTAGGHAIEEREMIGTPMEMVTLYHLEGPELVATHYCVLGNRPRLTATRELSGDTLAFSCTGTPGNARSHDEEHVHAWSMRLDEDGRLHYSADLVKDGKVTEALTMILTRQSETARR